MSETYNGPWVETQVAGCAEEWNLSAGDRSPGGPAYSLRDHQAREIAYDAELKAVEWEARRVPRTAAARAASRENIIASFAQFAANALDLEPDTTALLTHDFLPAGVEFALAAQRFDSTLSRADIIQACRNAWTACGLQPLLGKPMGITPSILAYSLLYPYSDNYLDATNVPTDAKLTFSQRFRDRLHGASSPAKNAREAKVWALVELIEAQYPREAFPQVFDSLLAIHQAQEDSLAQLRGMQPCGDANLLQLSFAKGGTSVLADACLARGWLTRQESQLAFAWGALLQLGDDLQDVREDLRRGSVTLFTRAAFRGEPLDSLVTQLLGLCERIGAHMNALPNGTHRLKNLLRMSWRSLIIGAVADAQEFFSPRFLLEAERCSPFRFEFLRAHREKLAGREGLYPVLFDLFIEARCHDTGEPLLRGNRQARRLETVL
jgi:hypothetical protein